MVVAPSLNVYLIPGMSADAASFASLDWDEQIFVPIVLPWLEPQNKETLDHYVGRMSEGIDRSQPFALVGVSFGGIIAQELSLKFDPVATVVISSIKSAGEKPAWMRLGFHLKLYRLLPFFMMRYINYRPYKILPSSIERRLRQYDHYLPMRSEHYLRWSVHQILLWDKAGNSSPPIHIHGDRDEMFPLRNISNAHIIKGGSHVMIITHARKISKLLATILVKSSE